MSVMSKSMMQSAAAQRRCVVTRMVPFRGERTTICSDLGSKFSTSSRQILCSSDEDCGLGHVRERSVTGPFTSCDAGFAHTTFHWPNLSSTSNLPPKFSSPLPQSHEKFSPKGFCLLRTVFFFQRNFHSPVTINLRFHHKLASALGHGSDSVSGHLTAGATSWVYDDTIYTRSSARRWPQQISVFFFLG